MHRPTLVLTVVHGNNGCGRAAQRRGDQDDCPAAADLRGRRAGRGLSGTCGAARCATAGNGGDDSCRCPGVAAALAPTAAAMGQRRSPSHLDERAAGAPRPSTKLGAECLPSFMLSCPAAVSTGFPRALRLMIPALVPRSCTCRRLSCSCGTAPRPRLGSCVQTNDRISMGAGDPWRPRPATRSSRPDPRLSSWASSPSSEALQFVAAGAGGVAMANNSSRIRRGGGGREPFDPVSQPDRLYSQTCGRLGSRVAVDEVCWGRWGGGSCAVARVLPRSTPRRPVSSAPLWQRQPWRRSCTWCAATPAASAAATATSAARVRLHEGSQ